MDEVQLGLKARYAHIHPLIFQRSLEKAKTNGELFDILEGIPKKYPIVWDENNRCWKNTDDLLQAQNIEKNKN
jgi:hypothetical protein